MECTRRHPSVVAICATEGTANPPPQLVCARGRRGADDCESPSGVREEIVTEIEGGFERFGAERFRCWFARALQAVKDQRKSEDLQRHLC